MSVVTIDCFGNSLVKERGVVRRVLLVLLLLWVQGVAAVESPRLMLERVAGQMLAALSAREAELRADPHRLHLLVEELLVPHVALELVARRVLGKEWRRASREQRERFAREFKEMLIRFYSSALLEYAGFRFRFHPVRLKEGQRRAVVRSEVMRGGGPPHSVNYSVVLRNGEWQVYDVTIDGVSVVVTYRSSFAEEIRHGGLDALLERMARWNRERR